MQTLRYNLRAAYESGHTDHPQRELDKMGFTILKWAPGEIGDCVFVQVKEDHNPHPDFIFPCNYQFSEES